MGRLDKRIGFEAMDIDWMAWRELTQAVPPAYTEYIGRWFIRHHRGEPAYLGRKPTRRA